MLQIGKTLRQQKPRDLANKVERRGLRSFLALICFLDSQDFR